MPHLPEGVIRKWESMIVTAIRNPGAIPNRLIMRRFGSHSVVSFHDEQANHSPEFIDHGQKAWWHEPIASIDPQIRLILSRTDL